MSEESWSNDAAAPSPIDLRARLPSTSTKYGAIGTE